MSQQSCNAVLRCVERLAWQYIACVASVSSRGSSRKLGQEQKKNEWRGRGRGTKEPLARKPRDFEKLRSPANAASDWRGAGSVDYLAFETSIKPGMLWFRTSQIWSHLICGSQITNALNWYLLESCLCEGLWDQSLQSIIGDRAVETMRIWLEKMDCLLEININQNIGTRH